MQIDEAIKIDGFDETVQHEYDKLCNRFNVFKSRANVESPSYVRKVNQFMLAFREYLDKCESSKGRLFIKKYLQDIAQMLASAPAGEKPKAAAKEIPSTQYVNPNNGGEYWDGDVHVYEAPADEDTEAAVEKLRKAGYKVTK